MLGTNCEIEKREPIIGVRKAVLEGKKIELIWSPLNCGERKN
jgi:hypothetical protein